MDPWCQDASASRMGVRTIASELLPGRLKATCNTGLPSSVLQHPDCMGLVVHVIYAQIKRPNLIGEVYCVTLKLNLLNISVCHLD